MLGARLGTALG
jgi:phage tail tape-measure protein